MCTLTSSCTYTLMDASGETRPKLVQDGTTEHLIGRDSEPHLHILPLCVKTDTDNHSPTTFAPVVISESTISWHLTWRMPHLYPGLYTIHTIINQVYGYAWFIVLPTVPTVGCVVKMHITYTKSLNKLLRLVRWVTMLTYSRFNISSHLNINHWTTNKNSPGGGINC